MDNATTTRPTTRTIWVNYPRNFANEFTLAVACDSAIEEQLRGEGFEPIEEDVAIALWLEWNGEMAEEEGRQSHGDFLSTGTVHREEFYDENLGDGEYDDDRFFEALIRDSIKATRDCFRDA